jgi:hypothetical protein
LPRSLASASPRYVYPRPKDKVVVESLMEHGEALPAEPPDQAQVSAEPQVAVIV